MNKIMKTLNSINTFSKKMIIAGCGVVVTFCIIASSMFIYNHLTSNLVEINNIASSLIQKSTVVFAQFIIGALIFDYLKAVIDSNNDE